MGGHDKCLLLMKRGGGGVKKPQKPAYVIHGCFLIYFRHFVTKTLQAEDIMTGLVDTFGETLEKINLVKKEDGGVQVGFTANGATTTATVVTPNIKAKNGIIHEVDTILLETQTLTPTDDLIQVLEN